MIVKEEINGIEIVCETGEYYFSPKNVDRGTRLMLETVPVREGDKVLDLGCGYGVVGIYASKLLGGDHVVMCDILEDAVTLSTENLARNGIEGAKAFIEDGFRKLAVAGRMVMVTKRLDWYRNKLKTLFGGVKVFEAEDYYIFLSEKRALRVEKPKKNTQTMSKKLQRKYGKK